MNEQATTPLAVAFFDFDGTLCRGDSILPYLVFAVSRGMAKPPQLIKALGAYFGQIGHPERIVQAKEKTLSFMAGRIKQDMDVLGADFARQILLPRLFPKAVDEMNRLRDQGLRIVVVSASPTIYMAQLSLILPVDDVIATPCQLSLEGYYTGHILWNCRGEQKLMPSVNGWSGRLTP